MSARWQGAGIPAQAPKGAVIPAKAGIQLSVRVVTARSWTPAFAGVTDSAVGKKILDINSYTVLPVPSLPPFGVLLMTVSFGRGGGQACGCGST